MTKPISLSLLTAVAVLVCAPRALAWDPFRSENRNVARGNDRLEAHDADGALHSYEAAARELPAEPGVHLDRGLALLAKGVLDRAREALLIATEPPAPAPVRADAYYDIGVAFYQAGDAAAHQAAQQAQQGAPLQGAPGAVDQGQAPHVDHREASRIFREAADGFRRSLRVRPGNRDAAWNLELALHRIHDEDEAQRQQDEQQRQQQQQQQGQQGQQGQDQQGQQNGQQQQQQGQQGQQGQQQQQQGQQGQQGQQQQQQGQQGDQQSQDPNGAQGQQDQHQQQAGSASDEQRAAQEQAAQSARRDANGLPANVARVLDALPDSTVERARARARALREDREPTQDW